MAPNKPTNIILSIKGDILSAEEIQLFQEVKPLGVILFARNIKDEAQVSALTTHLREVIGPDLLVLIDQEGGRVARIKFGFGGLMKPAQYFVDMINEVSTETALKMAEMQYFLCGVQLKKLGINVNCAPVADLYYDFAHKIIGDRSFGSDVDLVVRFCKHVEAGLNAAGVSGVLKHIPGHGRALLDSHHMLPCVETDLPTLEDTDFKVFKNLSTIPMAMTAHIEYTAICKDQKPVTLSRPAIDYIRKELGYSGIIMTDDLAMKALSKSARDNFKESIEAGCDIGLYCEGNIAEMRDLALECTELSDKLYAKVQALCGLYPASKVMSEKELNILEKTFVNF